MWKMKEEWEEVKLNTSVYRDSNVSILSSVDDIQTMLDDQIIKTQTMRGSHFIKPFEKEIKVNSTFVLLLPFLPCHLCSVENTINLFCLILFWIRQQGRGLKKRQSKQLM